MKANPKWAQQPLAHVVDILDSRRVPVRATDRAARGGDVPYYGATGQAGTIDEALFDEPLVLLGEDGAPFFDPYKAKAYLIEGPAWVNNHAHVLRAKPTLDRRFLKYYLDVFDYRSFANGTTRLKLTQGAMRVMPVPTPEISEQRRIVEILEEHLSHLDAADAQLRSAEARLSSLRRASLDRLFGRDLTTTLGDLVSDISAGKSFGSANSPAGDDEWGIIKVSAMTWGAFDASQNKAVAADRVDPRHEIRPGDLLVSRANTSEYVGASVLVGEVRPRLLLSDKSLRITPRAGVSAEWLWRALQSPTARRQISAMATGTKDSMRNISQASLKAVRLPEIDAHGQSVALQEFADVDDSSERLLRGMSKQGERSQSLRRSVLVAAFEGKLTGRQIDAGVIEEMANV